MVDYTKLKSSLQETIKERNDLKAVANDYGVNIENSTPFVEYHNFFDDKLNENANEIQQISQELQGKIEEYNNLNAEYAEYTNEVNEVKDDLKTVANNNGGAITEQTPFSEYSSEFERVIGDKYEQGKTDGEQSERDSFWNAALSGSKASNTARFAGPCWNDETFKPTFDVTFSEQGLNMFYTSQMTDIVSSLEKCGVTFSLVNIKNATTMYGFAKTKSTLPMTLLNCNMASTFASCSNLITIGKLTLSGSDTFYANTFSDCPNIENIELEGVIGKNNFNVQWSPKLTKASLLNILNCLKDYSQDTSGTVWTVTLGSTNKAKLTETELKIAENKGWRVV